MGTGRVSLAHGNGGRLTRELVEEIFARALGDAAPDVNVDAAEVSVETNGELLVTTDAFTVQPLEFPGGSLGSLAIHGTVNDLAVAGAVPYCLTLSAILEEGLDVHRLKRLVEDLARAARETGVAIVAGDTKVVPRAHGGGAYFVTTGVGVRPRGLTLHPRLVRPGDRILVSGPVGDHGTAVLFAREEYGLRGDLESDAASVLPLARAARDVPGVRFLRDPTRGGVAMVACDLARLAGVTVRLVEGDIPVREPVQAVCEILGYDPYYLACEGRVVAVAEPQAAETVLALWRGMPDGVHAADVGGVEAGPPLVVLETAAGGERVLDELEEDPLPRIC